MCLEDNLKDLKPEQLIIQGLNYSAIEDWDTIDKVIRPIYREKVNIVSKSKTDKDNVAKYLFLNFFAETALKTEDPIMADYISSMAADTFIQSVNVPDEECNELISFIERFSFGDVFKDNEAVRFWSAVALSNALKNNYELSKDKLNHLLQNLNLKENDRDFGELAREHIKYVSNLLKYID